MRLLRRLRQRRHQVLATVAFANFVVAALHFGLASAGPQLRSELGLGEAGLGLLLALPALGLMSGTFVWGLLADRFDERRVLSLAFVGFAVAASALAVQMDAASFDVQLAVPLLLVGLFGGAAHSAGGRAITAAYPEHRRGLALSLRHAAIPLGSAAGGVWIPAIGERASLQDALWVFGLLGLVSAVALWLVVPATKPAIRLVDAHDALAPRSPSPLGIRRMQLLCCGCAGLAVVQLGLGSFFTVFLVDEAGLALAAAAVAYGATQVGGTIGRVVLGVASDRVEERARVLQWVTVVGLVLVAVAALLPSAALRGVALAAVLVLATSWNGVAMAVASSLSPAGREGATIGMLTTTNAAACAVAPVLLGATLDRAGWTAFIAVLAVALAAAAVSFRGVGITSGASAR